jgi:hypothetical protein
VVIYHEKVRKYTDENEHERLPNITLRQDTDVNEHERLPNITLRQDTDVNKHERLPNITLRQDTDVNKHERLPNITLRNKLFKEQCFYYCSTFTVTVRSSTICIIYTLK